MGERTTTDIDKKVGQRVRTRRLELGLTQGALADALHVAPQQVQKYETGTNRVSASRLYALSAALDLPINRFFDGLPMGPDKDCAPDAIAKSLSTPEGVRLALLFSKVKKPTMRRRIVELAEAMVGVSP